MKGDIITIPVSATYQIVGGKAVRVRAEYREISADTFARFIMDGLHIPYEKRPAEGVRP